MTQLFEIIFVFISIILTNNIFIKIKDKSVFSFKMFILNLLGFVIYAGIIRENASVLQSSLAILTVGALIFTASSANEGFFIAFILQVLALTLITSFSAAPTLLELTVLQSNSLWREIPSWILIYQPYAFILFILSAVLYSKNPFMKTLTLWLIVYLFLGGDYTRGFEALGLGVFCFKAFILVLFVNIIEAIGFTELKVLEKINNRPIMVLWVLNIVNNVFGIFKI